MAPTELTVYRSTRTLHPIITRTHNPYCIHLTVSSRHRVPMCSVSNHDRDALCS
jgi:hypothetical protein